MNPGSIGSYNLTGSGYLSAATEYVASGGSGTFQQTGGTNSTDSLTIGSLGRYQFTGGGLQLTGGLVNQGVFDATGSTGTLTVTGNGIFDLSQAVLVSTGSMSLSVGANSLVLLPAGFNPATALRSYRNQGVVHPVGAPLTIPPGESISGNGSLSDLVNCQGTIAATTSGAINLNGGLALSGTGNVSLGSGVLSANGSQSGIMGGSLSAQSIYIGYSAGGTYTQSGGSVTAGNNLYVGSPRAPAARTFSAAAS